MNRPGYSGTQVFVTSAAYEGAKGREVIHFNFPIKSDRITGIKTWNALGMRGTGSNSVKIEGVFIPDDAVVARRPAGSWHSLWSTIIRIALPLISSVYVGLAESAASLATTAARKCQSELAPIVGEMMTAFTSAQITLADMLHINDNCAFEAT